MKLIKKLRNGSKKVKKNGQMLNKKLQKKIFKKLLMLNQM